MIVSTGRNIVRLPVGKMKAIMFVERDCPASSIACTISMRTPADREISSVRCMASRSSDGPMPALVPVIDGETAEHHDRYGIGQVAAVLAPQLADGHGAGRQGIIAHNLAHLVSVTGENDVGSRCTAFVVERP